MTSLVQIIGEVFSRVLILYIGVAAGFYFMRSPLAKYRKEFVDITINIFTPFLIVVSFLGIDISSALIYPFVAVIIVTTLGIAVPKVVARLTNSPQPDPAEICTATFPNALNFPFPIIFAFAPEGLGIASVFLGLTTLARNSIGFWISGSSIDKESVKQIALFPPIWGIFLGIGVRFSSPQLTQIIPEISIIKIIFQIGIFATLMTVGFGLTKPRLEYVTPILRTGLTRYVVMSIIGFSIVMFFSTPYLIAVPFIVQLMAPPAVYNGLYAEKLGLNTELTSQVIVTLTLIGLLFLPVEIFAIQLIA